MVSALAWVDRLTASALTRTLSGEVIMSIAALDENNLKKLLKSALVEALDERRDLVQEIVEDALEDLGLARAIDRGLRGGSVSRKQVLTILEANSRES
jgi:hypothetical protein